MKLYQEAKRKQKSYSVYLKILGVAVCILVLQSSIFSQSDSSEPHPTHDSAKLHFDSTANRLYQYVKKFGDSEQRKKLTQYAEDTIATKQELIVDQIRRLMLEAQNYLENGLDTSGLGAEIKKIEDWYEITGDGVFTNTGTIQTHRNLETSYKIMRELLTRMTARKSSLDQYYRNLIISRNTIDSLYKDSVLYRFSSDSVVLMRYIQKLNVVLQEIKPIDSAFKKTLANVSELQPAVNRMVNKLSAGLEQIGIFQQELSSRTFNRETSNLGGRVRYVRSFNEIISFSMIKALLSLVFYIKNEVGKVILLFLLLIAAGIFLRRLKRDLHYETIDINTHDGFVLKYPLLSSTIVVVNCFQFVFVEPPFILTMLLWVISAILLTIILKHLVSAFWFFSWLILLTFFLLACFDNLILQASRPERWMMFALSVAGIIAGSMMLLMWRRKALKVKLFIWSIGFVVLMQLVSILANGYGRYNLAKTCFTAGFFNVVLAIIFFWTLRFINQVLALSAQTYNKPGRKLFKINFEPASGKAPAIFYVLLFFGWFVLFARNFYAYKLLADPVSNFILQKRTIGDFSFSIANMLEFFLVLYVSGLISRAISFFASAKTTGDVSERGGLGNWLLIIRIAIMSIGVLIAFAVAGIPMDKLTIILSALSVGVGFGLQTLVNNLVSGLIISFEKPVRVGDIVDVGNQSGTVKSIGFRSSIITTIAGADVVIPNGDLLNQHLVNWTHENTYRSVDVPLSIAHGADIEQVIKLLKALPAKDDRILITPAPNVIVKQIGSGSIDMQLSFWVENSRQWALVKSDIILAIEHALKENGIHIARPQQELHIHSFSKYDTLSKKKVEGTE